MTNAEKYLKEGVNGIRPLLDKCREIGAIDSGREYKIDQMLREQVKPTLTEDERVILKNMDTKNYTHLYRTDNLIFLKNKKEHLYWIPFSNNFQFIKERRRI